MHRRQFINAAAGALLLPAGLARARQDPAPDATPAATPQHHGRPRPIVLGDGIELIDYRIYPSPDVPRIIGEISSTRDEMVDSPVISITFPDLGADGLAYAPPVLPVMRPGESNMIFGVLPAGIDSDEQLQAANFGLCAEVAPGEQTALNGPHEWELSDVEEDRRPGAQYFTGNLTNTGTLRATSPILQGIVRDAANRYVGTTSKGELGNMPAGFTRPFSLWSAADIDNSANPYVFLGESLSYSTELVPGVVGLRTLPGCPSLFGLG